MHFIISFLSYNKNVIWSAWTVNAGRLRGRLGIHTVSFNSAIFRLESFQAEQGSSDSDPTDQNETYQVFLLDDSVWQDNMKQLKWQKLQKARKERGRYELSYKIVRQWPKMKFIDSSEAISGLKIVVLTRKWAVFRRNWNCGFKDGQFSFENGHFSFKYFNFGFKNGVFERKLKIL